MGLCFSKPARVPRWRGTCSGGHPLLSWLGTGKRLRRHGGIPCIGPRRERAPSGGGEAEVMARPRAQLGEEYRDRRILGMAANPADGPQSRSERDPPRSSGHLGRTGLLLSEGVGFRRSRPLGPIQGNGSTWDEQPFRACPTLRCPAAKSCGSLPLRPHLSAQADVPRFMGAGLRQRRALWKLRSSREHRRRRATPTCTGSPKRRQE